MMLQAVKSLLVPITLNIGIGDPMKFVLKRFHKKVLMLLERHEVVHALDYRIKIGEVKASPEYYTEATARRKNMSFSRVFRGL